MPDRRSRPPGAIPSQFATYQEMPSSPSTMDVNEPEKWQRLEEIRLIQIPADEYKDQPAMCFYGYDKWFNNQEYVITVGMLRILE